MEKQYKCIRAFEVDEVDGDGFRTGDFKYVEEGSTWQEDKESVNVTGAEIHLECVQAENDEIPWVEISRADLEKDFEEI
jgi:hypothetical protein